MGVHNDPERKIPLEVYNAIFPSHLTQKPTFYKKLSIKDRGLKKIH